MRGCEINGGTESKLNIQHAIRNPPKACDSKPQKATMRRQRREYLNSPEKNGTTSLRMQRALSVGPPMPGGGSPRERRWTLQWLNYHREQTEYYPEGKFPFAKSNDNYSNYFY